VCNHPLLEGVGLLEYRVQVVHGSHTEMTPDGKRFLGYQYPVEIREKNCGYRASRFSIPGVVFPLLVEKRPFADDYYP
jgi:hypothetical protein